MARRDRPAISPLGGRIARRAGRRRYAGARGPGSSGRPRASAGKFSRRRCSSARPSWPGPAGLSPVNGLGVPSPEPCWLVTHRNHQASMIVLLRMPPWRSASRYRSPDPNHAMIAARCGGWRSATRRAAVAWQDAPSTPALPVHHRRAASHSTASAKPAGIDVHDGVAVRSPPFGVGHFPDEIPARRPAGYPRARPDELRPQAGVRGRHRQVLAVRTHRRDHGSPRGPGRAVEVRPQQAAAGQRYLNVPRDVHG